MPTEQGGSRPTAILAEDEPLLAAELGEALGQLWPELRIEAVAADGVAALREFERLAPDVAFLDIQMPRLTGLEVASQIGRRAHVVFVTAYDEHAVRAFEAGAVDYVLKPFQMARLATTVQRVKERLGSPPPNIEHELRRLGEAAPAQRRHLQWINASRGNGVRMIMVDDICYFKADHKYTLVVEEAGESVIRKTIRELGEELDPAMFWQVHRSTLVNVSAIEGVLRDDRGGLQLQLKHRAERLTVSEPYFSLFRQM
jgi:DNA-binding LytR/AlgR family response regulator